MLILRSLKEPVSGKSENFSDCRAYSQFETMPGSRVSGHSEIFFSDEDWIPLISSKFKNSRQMMSEMQFLNTIKIWSNLLDRYIDNITWLC